MAVAACMALHRTNWTWMTRGLRVQAGGSPMRRGADMRCTARADPAYFRLVQLFALFYSRLQRTPLSCVALACWACWPVA